jgi:hypothetical protein
VNQLKTHSESDAEAIHIEIRCNGCAGATFAATHEMKVKVEIDRMSSELVKLDRPWMFVAR